MRRTILLLLGITLSACVQEQPTLTTTAAFNPAEVAWATRPGTNTVQGFAVLRTVGGEARTCAGLEMRLIPDSSYARERMMSLYGNLSVGSRPIGGSRFGVTDSDYLATSKSARCDGQGNFTFEQIADGTWYVAGAISWMIGNDPRPQGANMMKRIEVRGGQTVKVSLP